MALIKSQSTDSLPPMRRSKWRRRLLVVSAIVGIILIWGGIDLYAPRTAHLKEFDPDEVARLETAMWRSYYEKHEVRLFWQLAEMLRTQYNMPLIRSNRVAYHAAKAAFVFKKGKQRSDYEQALPDLLEFYRAVRAISDLPFDVERAARLELEWWIIHRERANHAEGDLARALAELQAELYHVPIDKLMEHAQLRAEAMTIRDTRAEAGGVSEADWKRIDELLRGSWHSLSVAVKS